jgi:hypothetical protein
VRAAFPLVSAGLQQAPSTVTAENATCTVADNAYNSSAALAPAQQPAAEHFKKLHAAANAC